MNPAAMARDRLPEQIRVRLYVAGDSPNSVTARLNLRAALVGQAGVEVEIIDVLVDPERALRDGVLVTPMLVKAAPPPQRQLLGSLRDRPALLLALGLGEASP